MPNDDMRPQKRPNPMTLFLQQHWRHDGAAPAAPPKPEEPPKKS